MQPSVGKMLVLSLCLIFVGSVSPRNAKNMEKQLLNDLLSEYGSSLGAVYARPVFSADQTVFVRLQLALIQMNFDEKKKTLNLSAWTKYQWIDQYLQWNVSKYNGLERIRIDPKHIWMPDIQLQNTGNVAKSSRDTHAIVWSDGYITYYTLVHYSVSCALNLTNFPFDMQHCSLLMGSWVYPSYEVDIEITGGIDLSNWGKDFKRASSWDILNTTGTKSYMPENSSMNYALVTFELTLLRKVVFSTYILTLPCVFLACLTISVFWLPPHRPDRTALAMNTFASFMLLLLILVESAPPTTSTVPLLGVYYCLNIVAIVLAIILSTIVVNLSKGSARPVPHCILKIIHSRLGKAIMLHEAPTESFARSLSKSNKHHSNPYPKNAMLLQDMSESEPNIASVIHYDTISECASGCRASVQIKKIAEELKVLRSNLRNIADQTSKHKRKAVVLYKKDWELFGIFLDRIFCIIYIILAVLALVFFFPRPGNAEYL